MTLAKQETNKQTQSTKQKTNTKQTNKQNTNTNDQRQVSLDGETSGEKENIHHYLYIHKEKDSYIKIIHLNKVHFAFVITFSNASV